MRRELSSLVAGVLLLAGCSRGGHPGANSTATATQPGDSGGDTTAGSATLIGYQQIANPSGTRNTAGPVRVPLPAVTATKLADRIAALAQASAPHCMEPAALIYKINFSRGVRDASGNSVSGYRCAAAVGITGPNAKATAWRRDTDCQVFKEVRRLLPPSARGTRGATVGCG